MKTKTTLLLLLVLLIFGSITQSAFAQGRAAARLVVNTSFLNVRTGDGPQYSAIAIVVGGTELPVLGRNGSNSWYLVATAVGNGWVDVSFTLPRGDFSNVPVVTPTVGTSAQTLTALSIQLPTAYVIAPLTTNALSAIQTSTRAVINVLSVNLRSSPADNGGIIKTLYKDDNVDFAIVGHAYDDRGVRWVAITVPNVGTGWIEEAKISTRPGTGTASTISASSAVASGVTALELPRVVINTSYQNIRTGPGPQFDILAVAAGGTTLEVVGVTSDVAWYQVRGAFGLGWVASDFVLFRGTFGNVPLIHNVY